MRTSANGVAAQGAEGLGGAVATPSLWLPDAGPTPQAAAREAVFVARAVTKVYGSGDV